MPRNDSTQEPDESSSDQDETDPFRLPEGTKVTFDLFGRHYDVDPDSPLGGLSVVGLIVCISLQVVFSLLAVSGSSGGLQTVTALVMAAAIALVCLTAVSALRGSSRKTTDSLMRAFCVLVLVAIVLSLIQNSDDLSQVVTGIMGLVVTLFILRHLRK